MLTMTVAAALVGSALVGETVDLRTRCRADDSTGHLGASELGGRGQDGGTVDDQNRLEVDCCALLRAEKLHMDVLALGHTDLFATGCDHCVHSKNRLYLVQGGETNAWGTWVIRNTASGGSQHQTVIDQHSSTLAFRALARVTRQQTLADSLAGHFHESEFGNLEDLSACLVARQC